VTVDPTAELVHTLLDGVDQGTANVVAIGTSAAAAAAWHKVRALLRQRHPSPGSEELAVLSAEPGQEVDVQALRSLLRMLSPAELATSITVHGDYVARDKNVSIQGDYIGRDKRVY
jgi:hypothetical protein